MTLAARSSDREVSEATVACLPQLYQSLRQLAFDPAVLKSATAALRAILTLAATSDGARDAVQQAVTADDWTGMRFLVDIAEDMGVETKARRRGRPAASALAAAVFRGPAAATTLVLDSVRIPSQAESLATLEALLLRSRVKDTLRFALSTGEATKGPHRLGKARSRYLRH